MTFGLAMIALFGFVIASSFMRTRYVPGRAFALFRALFPSWRFFDDVGHVPQLLCRLGPTPDQLGPWRICVPNRTNRTELKGFVGSLFLNPQGNLRMACNSLVEQLMSDLGDFEVEAGPGPGPCDESQFVDTVSYQLTRDLVRYWALRAHGGQPGWFSQFRVLFEGPQGEEGKEGEEALVSLVHEL